MFHNVTNSFAVSFAQTPFCLFPTLQRTVFMSTADTAVSTEKYRLTMSSADTLLSLDDSSMSSADNPGVDPRPFFVA